MEGTLRSTSQVVYIDKGLGSSSIARPSQVIFRHSLQDESLEDFLASGDEIAWRDTAV
jgi:hypothetical protein